MGAKLLCVCSYLPVTCHKSLSPILCVRSDGKQSPRKRPRLPMVDDGYGHGSLATIYSSQSAGRIQVDRRTPNNGLDGIFPAHLLALRSGLF
jgi:hypothetical protein